MTGTNALRKNLTRKLAATAERWVSHFSLYVLPAVIVVVSVLALFALRNQYPVTAGHPVALRVVAEAGAPATPDTMLAALRSQPAHTTDTIPEISGTAWLLAELTQTSDRTERALDFPSRRISTLECWNAQGNQALGHADKAQTSGSMRQSRLGYAVMLSRFPPPVSVLCRATLAEPTQLSADLWSITDLRQAVSRFDRGIGLLEGGLLTISLFILIIALTTREWVYLLLAMWLMGNLRLGALAMGWDAQWLGRAIPVEWMPFIRQVTVAAYYLLTHTLLTQLFRRGDTCRFSQLWRAAQWAGIVLLAAALALPYSAFRPIMWAVCGFGIGVAFVVLSHAVYTTRSRVWLWHVVSLSMALCVMASGMLLLIFGRNEFLDAFNGVIALLLSSVMVALAVAERMREERQHRIRAQNELISTYSVTPIGMFTLDHEGVFSRANPVLEKMLGFAMDQGAPVRWTDYFPPQDWRDLAKKTDAHAETEIERLGSPERSNAETAQHFVVRISMASGRIEGSLQDITARIQTIEKLRRIADNDPLTDVLNRRGIEKALDASLTGLAQGMPCALAYINLDHYKRINSLFGHTSGDEVLQQVCERIKKAVTDQEHIGRIGGDEFIILFPDSTIEEAREAAGRVIQTLNGSAVYAGGRAFQIKSAVGIIEIDSGMSAKEMISAASRACRDARKLHQDIVVYQQDSHELQEHTEELRLFDELEGGDSPRGLYLEMQPIMSLKNPLQSLNFEILLRVRNSTGTLVPTGKIIAAAEESGTITIIDKWVFSATLEWLDKHEHRLARTEMVTVNLSGVSLNDDKFIESFFTTFERYAHLASRLCIEITEGVALQDLARMRRFMERLQRMGARVALDDFGAGYTSFSYLKELRADAIKIDGALIKDMMANETNKAIVRTIVELARNLDMKSIAEWAEDCATLRALREMGVDYVQGFVVSRAKSPAEILNAVTVVDLISNDEVIEIIHEIMDGAQEDDTWR
ncbi:MAG TPA: EAL domain-containing protein [Candidimonas sp.]|nr:EAL domain-containing protein [Candidimonas sp.]